MTVAQLQNHVSELDAAELEAFSRWFENFIAEQWDRQIEADANNGNLDRMVKNLGLNFDKDATETLSDGLARVSRQVRAV